MSRDRCQLCRATSHHRGHYRGTHSPAEQGCLALIGDGVIKPPPTAPFPLAEAAAAHPHLESGENTGKIILAVP